MIEIKGSSADELFIEWKRRLKDAPVVEVRRLKTKELLDTVTRLSDPFNCVLSSQNEAYYRYSLKELLFYMTGSLKVEDAAKISSFWKNVAENDKINSNYGYHCFYRFCPAAHNQFEWCKNELMKDQYSRKAVININGIEHKNGIEKDMPCTVAYQFFIRDSKLTLRSYMRSNDLIYGWRYDLQWECFLLILMWLFMRQKYPLLEVGEVIHIAASLHLYEKDWEEKK